MTIERQIIDTAARLRRQREPHLIATVVRVQGSAYRRPGARMLLTQFRWITGSVSGGRLEADIAKTGWSRTQSGEPVVITYDSSAAAHDEDIRSAFGLNSDSIVDVMLERAGTPGRLDPLELASECIRTQKRGAIVTVIRSRVADIKVGSRVAVCLDAEPRCDVIGDDVLRTAMIADARAAIASGKSCNRSYTSARGIVEVFVEAILPPPRVFVFGTGHDAVPVVQLAKQIGWEVSVCTDAALVSTRQRFSGADEVLVGTPEEFAARVNECDRAIAVVMSHEHETDRAYLGALMATKACYIGVLGPRARTMRMLDELQLMAHDDPRLHAPIGLELGAATPHEIGLAIVAEVQAVLARAPAHARRDGLRTPHERSMPRIAHEIATLQPVQRPSCEIAVPVSLDAIVQDVLPAPAQTRAKTTEELTIIA